MLHLIRPWSPSRHSRSHEGALTRTDRAALSGGPGERSDAVPPGMTDRVGMSDSWHPGCVLISGFGSAGTPSFSNTQSAYAIPAKSMTSHPSISRNPNRPEKRLWTAEGDGEKIVGYVGENEHDEAQFIAKEIDRLQDEADLRPGGRRHLLPHQRTVPLHRGCPVRVGFRTRWSAGPAFTSARKSRTRSPACACWSTRTTTSPSPHPE